MDRSQCELGRLFAEETGPLFREHVDFLCPTVHSWAGYELPDYYRLSVNQDDLKSYDCGFSDREIPMLLTGEKDSIVPLADICAD